MATIFTILPDSAKETWDWKTDVMTTHNGSETRMALRQLPRVIQRLGFKAVEQGERNEHLLMLSQVLTSPDEVPLFAWAAPVTVAVSSGTSVVTIDTTKLGLHLNDRFVLMNPQTQEAYGYTLTAVTDTTCDVSPVLDANIDSDWIGFKAMVGLLQNGSDMKWGVMTGEITIQVDSWQSPQVQRTGTSASLTTYNSLTLLERTFEDGIGDKPEFGREVVDFGLGAKTMGSRFTNMDIRANRTFIVDRADSDDMDYWRLFLDTVKGAQKAFLLTTQLQDMTLATGLSQGGTTMTINETDASAELHQYASFQNFEILYSDGTSTQHTISSSTTGSVTFAPALPSDPKVANVDRISYLLKVRMSDRLTWDHGPVYSRLGFNVFTTDDG